MISRDAIFFDGYLPEHKREERLARANKSRKELLSAKAKQNDGFPISGKPCELAKPSIPASKLLRQKTPRAMRRGIPTLPFLVPAAIEAIAESKYASVTRVVAGEADAFCAVAARTNARATLVLSSDSDLLVYDLGPKAGLADFNRFHPRKEEVSTGRLNGCEKITIKMSKPRDIARRLGLNDLERLAYHIKVDPTIKLPEAIERSTHPPGNPESLQKFLSEYDVENLALPMLDRYSKSHHAPSYLDPRISELIHQVNDDNSSEPINMYLPMLLEDPDRVSAWTETAESRAFAYSCLNIYSPGNTKSRLLQEVYRKGDRVGLTAMNWLDESETVAYASTYLNEIRDHMDEQSKPPRGEMSNHYRLWRSYALSLLCDPPLTIESSKHILEGNEDSSIWSWTDVQDNARLQASLYSLRIMQQILRHLESSGCLLPRPLLALLQTLKTLPPIRTMMPTRLEAIERGQRADLNPLFAPELGSFTPSSQPKPAEPLSHGISAIGKSPGQISHGEAAVKNEKRLKQDEKTFAFAKRQLQSADISATGKRPGPKSCGSAADKNKPRPNQDEKTFAFARRQLQSAGISATGESSGQKRHTEATTDKTEKRLKQDEKNYAFARRQLLSQFTESRQQTTGKVQSATT